MWLNSLAENVLAQMRGKSQNRTGSGDPVHQVENILQRARQAIELPDDDGVAITQLIEHAVKLGTFPAPARCLLLEDALATGLGQRPGLSLVRLFVAFAYAGVADQQGRPFNHGGLRICGSQTDESG